MIGQWFLDKVKELTEAHHRLVITDTQGDGAFLLAYLPARRYMVLTASKPSEERRVRTEAEHDYREKNVIFYTTIPQKKLTALQEYAATCGCIVLDDMEAYIKQTLHDELGLHTHADGRTLLLAAKMSRGRDENWWRGIATGINNPLQPVQLIAEFLKNPELFSQETDADVYAVMQEEACKIAGKPNTNQKPEVLAAEVMASFFCKLLDGTVGLWDALCFDESTDELFKDKEVVPLMKDYMESGSFSRAGKAGEKAANASIILNGNINQPVETVLKTSHLFSPFSDKIANDTAFLDRLSFFLPGWEIIKFAPHHFTNHFGFSTDFFSEWMHHQRKKSYVNAIDNFFILGSQMKQRDTKPVRKTVSGLIKLMHPDGNYTKEDVRQYLEFAIEMRRRVKEQLKRIGGMEFWDTNFSYIDKETQEETFVTLPEERGSNLIEDVPLAPGTCYTATSDGDKVTLVKLEVVSIPGNGKLTISGNASTEVKEDVRNTYNYIRANEKTILSQQHSLNKLDVNIGSADFPGWQRFG